MKKLLLITVAACTIFSWNPTLAEVHPSGNEGAQVQITEGPKLEFACDDVVIIRWTTNNPGGSDEHFGVVNYGTDPKKLNLTAKSHIRLNRDHPMTIFRVRLGGLRRPATYYYVVTSIDSKGKSDGIRSARNQFTTPVSGERVVALSSAKMTPVP